jgi:hypothetical protein
MRNVKYGEVRVYPECPPLARRIYWENVGKRPSRRYSTLGDTNSTIVPSSSIEKNAMVMQGDRLVK